MAKQLTGTRDTSGSPPALTGMLASRYVQHVQHCCCVVCIIGAVHHSQQIITRSHVHLATISVGVAAIALCLW
jgi:hypothetical protein